MKQGLIKTVLFLLFLSAQSVSAQLVDTPHSKVQLISEKASVLAGETVQLGFDFHLDQDWHIYWLNPGDSGAAPRVTWNKPENIKATDLKFPYPHRIDYGGLTSYGHDGRVLLVSEVEVPEDLSPGNMFEIDAHLGFLICEKICVPANADLSISIPVVGLASVVDPQWQDYFTETKMKWPLEDSSLEVKVREDDSKFYISLPSSDIDSLEFFSTDEDVIQYMDEQKFVSFGDSRELVVSKSEFLEGEVRKLNGVLVSHTSSLIDDRKAVQISAPIEQRRQTVYTHIDNDNGGSLGILVAIAFAFIGGLILNLMPCVLPVLSLKVLGLIKHAQDEKEAWKHGWAFTAGVIASFWVLTAILMILKGAGEHIGWGFQFQSPGFVIFMAWFLFLLALNLFGVFEIGESLTRLNWVKHHGLSASFLSGVLVTIVATPCTAPFMGAALAFALTQTVVVSFTIFFALGFGLAAPYLILTCNPGFLKFVPKPGKWMVSFKMFMGGLMLATALWFLWILDAQLGRNALWVMVGAIGLSCVGAWFLFHGQRNEAKQHFKPIATIVLIIGLVVGFQAPRFKTEIKTETVSKIEWVKYSPATVVSYRKAGKAVFVDFTARWCLTCQVNERVALENDQVVEAVKDKNIVMIKADWTNYDEEITKALESFGKNSIPFYVLYLPRDNTPIILPEVITPALVLEQFNKIQ